jgi:hypothetical protein
MPTCTLDSAMHADLAADLDQVFNLGFVTGFGARGAGVADCPLPGGGLMHLHAALDALRVLASTSAPYDAFAASLHAAHDAGATMPEILGAIAAGVALYLTRGD